MFLCFVYIAIFAIDNFAKIVNLIYLCNYYPHKKGET